MQSNCHATGSVTDLFGDSIITAIATNGFLLKNNLKSRGFLEADGISTPTGTIVPKRAAQILYNYLMYEHDGSVGVHNPKFMDTLLEMSLAAWDSIPPEAAFSVSDTLVCAGTPITFTNESVGDDVEWAWDFGDDGTSTDENPTYTYNAAGLYTVSFTAKSLAGDNDGADIVTKTDLINVLGLPDADFAVEGDTTGDCTMEVVFVDSSTNVDPATHGVVTYFWEFGDGATDTVPSPSHTYQVPFGTTDTLRYEVSLTVTTDCGSDTETRTDYIVMRPGAPVAGISVSPSNIGPVVNPFSFTAVSPGATSWLWDFGDGVGTSTESNPDYTFSTANDYWVKLTVSNLCGEDTDSVLVTAE